MIHLDERLGAIAAMVREEIAGKAQACVADVGCDHGYLSAYLLQSCPQLTVVASDISSPSLEKARQLFAKLGVQQRAQLRVADGLLGIGRRLDAVVIAGMGADTILHIVREGKAAIGDAALIVQANVDLPVLRSGLAQAGFSICKERFVQAAGRHYVTLQAKRGEVRELTPREAMLGSAVRGAQDEGQRAYFAWQRAVRVREMEQVALLDSQKAAARLACNSAQLDMISEAMGMNAYKVSDAVRMVGEIAPYELAEPWDNVGLLVGRMSGEVTRALIALDLTQGVIDEAKALGAQLIITHHPIMFSPRKRVTDEDREGALMLNLAQAGIAHIAAHTNLDAAPGGVNDTLMKALGAEHITGEGCIRVGDMPDGMTLETLAARAERSLHTRVRTYGAPDTPVRRLGCCSGAGSSELPAAAALGADCFITGEVKHNLALDAMAMGCTLIEAGHYETENPVCEVLCNALQNAADAIEYKVTFFCSKDKPFGR